MDLYARAKSQGVQTEFLDGQGHRRVTGEAALKIILDALPAGVPRRLLDQAVVVRSGHPARTELGKAAILPLRWKIVAGFRVIADGEAREHVIAWPEDLPEGVYRLHLTDASARTEEAPLMVAPPKAFGGDFDRCWLMAVQLYGVRSARNWGIGDFSDLAALIDLAGHWAPTVSASIHCMPCSTTAPAIAARIRRTAGYSSMHSISTSKKSPNSRPAGSPEATRRSSGCGPAISSTMPPSRP